MLVTKRILVVDDSKTILKLNSRLITNIVPGAEIITFETPQKALDTLSVENVKIDFAFLDYNMEGMNGIELATHLVGLPSKIIQFENISIVSANIQEAVMKKAAEMKIHFISKPLENEQLKVFFQTRGMVIS